MIWKWGKSQRPPYHPLIKTFSDFIKENDTGKYGAFLTTQEDKSVEKEIKAQ